MASFINYLKEFIIVIKTALANWEENRLTMMSAALAFYSILSLAPLIIIGITFSNLVLGHGDGAVVILLYAKKLFGNYAVKVIEIILSWELPGATSLGTAIVGIFVIFFGASRLLSMMQNTLNSIWSAHIKTGLLHHVVKREFRSLVIILSAGTVFVIFLILETMVSALTISIVQEGIFWWIFQHIIGFLSQTILIFGIFAIVNKALPHIKIRWKYVIPGSLLSALLFVLGNKFLAWYLGRNMLASIYGAASAIVLLLLWAYYVAQIFLLGAEVNKILVKTRNK